MSQATTAVKFPEFGARLRSARRRSGLSHDKLAAKVGTTRQHLIKLEKGWHRPGADLLAAIAAATGTSVMALDPPQEVSPSGDTFRGAGVDDDRGRAPAARKSGGAGDRVNDEPDATLGEETRRQAQTGGR